MKKSIGIIVFFLILSINLVAQTPPVRTWFQNDYGRNTAVKERWFENSQGLKHGTYIKYFSDGEREILGYYKNDVKNGQWEMTIYASYMFQQVKTISYINFLNGKPHGLCKTVSGGIVLSQGNYTNHIKTGYWKDDYNIEEKVYSEGNFINGERDGEWKNTSVTKKTDDEMGFGILLGSASAEKTETKKGFRTIYKNGEVVATYDANGVDIFKKQKEEAEIKFEKLNASIMFEKCTNKEDYEKFISTYPNNENVPLAKEKIKEWELVEEQVRIHNKERDAVLNPLMIKWESLHDSSKTMNFFDDYLKQFPDEYADRHYDIEKAYKPIRDLYASVLRKYELETSNGNSQVLLKMNEEIINFQYTSNHITLNSKTDNIGIYNEFFQKYPKVGSNFVSNKLKENIIQYKYQIESLIKDNQEHTLKIAFSMCSVINYFPKSVHNSFFYPNNITLALINWKLGNFDALFKEVEKHKNDIINYTTGQEKYSKAFKQHYKYFKIDYPNEKETWEKISLIFKN